MKDLFRLLAFRNTAKAFAGELETTDTGAGTFTLTWKTADETARLTVDLPKKAFAIVHSTADGEKRIF